MDLRNSVLAYWNELLRCGHLGFGNCEARKNWEAGPCFVTEVGRKGLENADRDPSNPAGYLAYLDREAAIDSVTRGYVEESLNAYRAGCYKATAVLIGAAVENLVLILRDELAARLKSGGKIPKGLDAWQVKTALDAATGKILPDLALEAKKKPCASCTRTQNTGFRPSRENSADSATPQVIRPAWNRFNLRTFTPTCCSFPTQRSC
jgi:hypothetical protein